MIVYEYKVVPAPSRGLKARGIKGLDGRFANALENVMNQMAAAGWEYQRTETLPNDERSGLTSIKTTYRNIMVFRRPRSDDVSAFQPRALDTAAPVAKLPAPSAQQPQPAPQPAPSAAPADDDPFMMAEATAADDGKIHSLPVALLARARAKPAPESEDVAAE